MMTEKNTPEKIKSDNILGPGLEPLAVCLMVLFIWMFFVSFVYEKFM